MLLTLKLAGSSFKPYLHAKSGNFYHMTSSRKPPNRTATRKSSPVQRPDDRSGLAREIGLVIKRTRPAAAWFAYLESTIRERVPSEYFEPMARYAAALASSAEYDLARKLQRFVDDVPAYELEEAEASNGPTSPAHVDVAMGVVPRLDSSVADLGPGAFLEEISRVNSAIATFQADLHEAVEIARAGGCSWVDIGSAVGVDEQAARYRFARRKR